MRLIEFDGKTLMARMGLPVPGAARLINGAAPFKPDGPVVLKAQILAGGRGKQGLVRKLEAAEIESGLAEMRAALVAEGREPLLMSEYAVEFEREYFIGWRIDDVSQRATLMFSPDGGVEVERRPESVRQLAIDPLQRLQPHRLLAFLREAGVTGRALGATARFAVDLHRLFVAEDAEAVEVNPLAVTSAGAVVALDCKMTVDGAAIARHPYWRELASYRIRNSDLTPLEAKAVAGGVTFVELPGDVVLLSSGAGLGMSLIDLMAEHGFAAANFCDASGGSGMAAFSLMTELALRRAESSEVKAIASFFTLSATSIKPAVLSLVEALTRTPPTKPFVVGFAATGAALREMSLEDARAEFARLGHACVADPLELMEALKRSLA